MKVKIGDTIYDPNDQPIMLVFKDDEDLRTLYNNLLDMPSKNGVRKYLMYNKDQHKKQYALDFMKIPEESVN
jgi:hypothetical protein